MVKRQFINLFLYDSPEVTLLLWKREYPIKSSWLVTLIRIVHSHSTERGASQVELVVKNPTASAGDVRTGSIPGSGSFPGGGHGNLLQYHCLENPMDRGVWEATVYGLKEISPDYSLEGLC